MRALEDHGHTLTDLHARAEQVITAARQQGLTVDVATMTITAPAGTTPDVDPAQTEQQIGQYAADLTTLLDRARTLDDSTTALLRTNSPTAGKGFGADVTTPISEAEVVQQGAYPPEQVHTWWTNLTPLQQEQAIQANTNLNNCEGGAGESSDDYSVYYVQGIYQASVPVDRQLAALAQVRQAWENASYTITQDRTFPDGNRGEVAATSPDGFDFSLFSGNVPAMLLLVGSPCYAQP